MSLEWPNLLSLERMLYLIQQEKSTLLAICSSKGDEGLQSET